MTLPDPRTEEAVDFLVRYSGSHPIVLTAIIPDGGGVESATFRPAEEQQRLCQWIDARQGRANVYFTVNPTLHPLNGRGVKAKKTDVRGLIALPRGHRPNKEKDIERERERIRSIIASYATPPTITIDSGGGYQVFWILTKNTRQTGLKKPLRSLKPTISRWRSTSTATCCLESRSHYAPSRDHQRPGRTKAKARPRSRPCLPRRVQRRPRL